MHEVNRPDMVLVMWPEPDNGTVLVIEPFALLMSFWELKSFFTPQALHLFMVYLPTFEPQQVSDFPRSVTPVFPCQADHSQTQGFLVLILSFGLILLRRTHHVYYAACPSFRCSQLLTSVNDGPTQLLNVQAFGFKKSRLSFKISLSSSNSATIFLSRSFSFCKAFISVS